MGLTRFVGICRLKGKRWRAWYPPSPDQESQEILPFETWLWKFDRRSRGRVGIEDSLVPMAWCS